MNENTPNPWDDQPKEETPQVKTKTTKAKAVEAEAPVAPQAPQALDAPEFDIDGLMTDFPTATQLERFVYDQTGIVLNLKGRANKLKYQVAMDVLNGQSVDSKFLGGENPYVDKAELVPEEPLKPTPPRDPSLPPHSDLQNSFYSPIIPHPDEEYRAQDKKVHMVFKKYNNGMISYEILGPLEKRPYGQKLDKFGRNRPEIIKWVDPRTGEQVIIREDGTLTPQGRRIRAMMQTFKVNKSNQWEVWIDREFISLNDSVAANPWDLDK
jgi:hypothetical protein